MASQINETFIDDKLFMTRFVRVLLIVRTKKY